MAFKKKEKKVKVNKKKRKEFEKKKRRRKRRRSSCAANSSNISSNISVCVWVLQPCCIMPLRTKKKKNSLLTMNAQVGTILLRKPQTKVNHFASEATSGPRAFVTHRPGTNPPPPKKVVAGLFTQFFLLVDTAFRGSSVVWKRNAGTKV